MSGLRRPGLDSREGAAWTAVLTLAAIALIQLATAGFVTGSGGEVWQLGGLAGTAVAAGAVLALCLPWERMPRAALLVLPVLMGGAFEGDAHLCPHLSPAYSPLLSILFVLAGLTQRRGVSLLLLPVGALCWLEMQAAVNTQVLVRMAVTTCVWAVVSELLAWKMNEHVRAHDVLSRAVHRDPLTGLGNRRALDQMQREGGQDAVLIMIDLDHFKVLNDTYGHLEGDRVLTDFAHVLVAVLRTGDGAYRYGGEEFLVIAQDTGPAGAERLLDRVTRAWSAVRPDVTFSAGVATWRAGEEGPAALRRADLALYRAKAAGRDCWRLAVEPTSALEPAVG